MARWKAATTLDAEYNDPIRPKVNATTPPGVSMSRNNVATTQGASIAGIKALTKPATVQIVSSVKSMSDTIEVSAMSLGRTVRSRYNVMVAATSHACSSIARAQVRRMTNHNVGRGCWYVTVGRFGRNLANTVALPRCEVVMSAMPEVAMSSSLACGLPHARSLKC